MFSSINIFYYSKNFTFSYFIFNNYSFLTQLLIVFFSFFVNGLFLLALHGIIAFSNNCFIPKYPKSANIIIFFENFKLLILNSLKSCTLPFTQSIFIIIRVAKHITNCALIVCRFFFLNNNLSDFLQVSQWAVHLHQLLPPLNLPMIIHFLMVILI